MDVQQLDMKTGSAIPPIDFNPFLDVPNDEWEKVASTIDAAFRSVRSGFDVEKFDECFSKGQTPS